MIARKRLPKHHVVAATLIEQIRAGGFRPGDLLPSESELSRQFGVSRHTIRVALRTLYEKGLVTSQQGLGTAVRDAVVNPRFSYTLESIDDLLQYAAATPRTIFETIRIQADDELATWLECEPGTFWRVVHTKRAAPSGDSAVASSRIFVPDAFGAAIPQMRTSDLPLFALLEQQFGVHIAEVRQILSVATASSKEAADLGIAEGAAVMCIVRRFLDERGRLLEVSRSVHPGETFHYTMTVRLNLGPRS